MDLVRTLSGPGSPGLNRVVWDLLPGEPRTRITRDEHAGQPQFVRPGAYRVTLRAGKGRSHERSLTVKTLPAVHEDAPSSLAP